MAGGWLVVEVPRGALVAACVAAGAAVVVTLVAERAARNTLREVRASSRRPGGKGLTNINIRAAIFVFGF